MFNSQENVGSGCVVPLLQAVAGGVITGLLAGAIAMGAQWKVPWLFGLTAGSLAAVIWFWSTVDLWRRSAYPAPEPGPGATRPAPTVRVVLEREDGADLIDLPANSHQLVQLARGVLEGQTLSESAWTGSGQPFTRAEFSNLRGELIRRGLATWNNPRTPARGVQLTRGGMAAMRTFASMSHYPTGADLQLYSEKQRGVCVSTEGGES
jgi:hypothetical protein